MMKKKENKWFVYILRCLGGRLYTGMTNNLGRRIKQHRLGKGGSFTRAFGVDKLVFIESHPTIGAALKREAEIKSWIKSKKLILINNEE